MTRVWTTEDMAVILSLKAEGKTNAEIGNRFEVGESTIRYQLKKVENQPTVLTDTFFGSEVEEPEDGVKAGPEPTIAETHFGDVQPGYTPSEFDMAMETLEDYIGWQNYEPKDPPECEIKDEWERILVINDLHVPYHDKDKLRWVVEHHKGKVDLCVVAGDVADLYSFSRYPKRSQHYTAVEEMISCAETLVLLAESFPRVVLLSGNHDERMRKHLISHGVEGDVLQAMLYLNENFCNPLAAVIQKHGLTNMEMAPVITNAYAEWNWIWQHGDLILGHPEKFSKIPNRVVGDFIDYLMRYRTILKLNDFRVVGAGHTHQAGKTWNNFGVVGFEMGCLSETPEYAADPKLGGARPAIKGYTMFYQDRATGRTDINASNFYELSD